MRLFLAILPDPDMRDALCAVQHELRRRGVEGNFTRPENLHLTLAFIGDYPDPDAVLEALSELRFEPFSLALDGLGAFGELWWAGLRGNEALDALVRRLRRALGDAGIPFDRKSFLPHITLVRRGSFNGKPPAVDVSPAGMTVDHFSLMRSDRTKSGMVYTEIGRVLAN